MREMNTQERVRELRAEIAAIRKELESSSVRVHPNAYHNGMDNARQLRLCQIKEELEKFMPYEPRHKPN